MKALKVKYVIQNDAEILYQEHQWDNEDGLLCEEAIMERLDEVYGCDGSCMNESINHCECTLPYEHGKIIDVLKYSGVKDDNKKEIYESDIISFAVVFDGPSSVDPGIYEGTEDVIFQDGVFGVYIFDHVEMPFIALRYLVSKKVVGNLYGKEPRYAKDN